MTVEGSPNALKRPISPDERDASYARALDAFEARIGIKFKDRTLLKKVFAMPLTPHELQVGLPRQNMEFIGDRLLSFLLAESLAQTTKFSELDKSMHILERNSVLSRVALDTQMNLCFVGTVSPLPRTYVKILGDMMEAFLYALYQDQGVETAKKFVEQHVVPLWQEMKSHYPDKNDELKAALEKALGHAVSSKKGQLLTLRENNPWIIWGYQGSAIPYFPLSRKGAVAHVHVPGVRLQDLPSPGEWELCIIEADKQQASSMQKLFESARENQMAIEFRQHKLPSGKVLTAVFANNYLVGVWSVKKGKGLSRPANRAYRKLEKAAWNLSNIDPTLIPDSETSDEDL